MMIVWLYKFKSMPISVRDFDKMYKSSIAPI